MKIFIRKFFLASKDYVKPLLCGVITLSWIGLATFFILYYPFSFNYETYLNDQYKLFVTIPFFSIILTGLLFKKKIELHILNISIFIVCSIILLLLSFSRYYSWGNEHFSVIGAILFISVGMLLLDNIVYIQITAIFFLLLFFYELNSGIIQWMDASQHDGNLIFAIKGTLQNSGIYACYLLVNLPLLYWLFWNTHFIKILNVKSKAYMSILYWTKRVIFLSIVLLSCILIFKTQSRTAYFAMIALTTSFLIINHGKSLPNTINKIPKSILFGSVIVAFSTLWCVSSYLFNLRKLSAIGRLMRVDLTLQHINDMFWFGTGLGRFTWYFPQWQADYFASHPTAPHSYFLSAGESFLVFNEYIQLFKEVGFFGFVVIIILIYCFYKTKSEGNDLFLNMLKVTATTIFACGFTSYPFHVNIFLLMIAFCFGSTIKFGKNNSFLLKKGYFENSIIMTGSIVILLALTIVSSYKSFYQYKAMKRLDHIRNDYNPNISIYDSLYLVLKHDGKFLAEYSMALKDISAENKRIAPILEEAKQYYISEKTIYALAKTYEKNGNYPKAIDNFRWLSNYLPNKFTPKYGLLKMYQKIGDTVLVRQLAKSILSMPVKIQSFEVEDIKSGVKNIQKEYTSP